MIGWDLGYAFIGGLAAHALGVLIVAGLWWDELTPLGRVLVVAVSTLIGFAIGGVVVVRP